MEIKVNIPKNDYVQPKEVRAKVVQDICNHIIYWMKNSCEEGFYQLSIKDFYYQNAMLYLIYSSSEKTKTSGFQDNGKIDEARYPFHVKVRTCEMQAVFKVMQKAGYHIFGSHNITDNVHTYIFTTKPVLNGQKAKKIDFGMFID
jgi:hypothetical protein